MFGVCHFIFNLFLVYRSILLLSRNVLCKKGCVLFEANNTKPILLKIKECRFSWGQCYSAQFNQVQPNLIPLRVFPQYLYHFALVNLWYFLSRQARAMLSAGLCKQTLHFCSLDKQQNIPQHSTQTLCRSRWGFPVTHLYTPLWIETPCLWTQAALVSTAWNNTATMQPNIFITGHKDPFLWSTALCSLII